MPWYSLLSYEVGHQHTPSICCYSSPLWQIIEPIVAPPPVKKFARPWSGWQTFAARVVKPVLNPRGMLSLWSGVCLGLTDPPHLIMPLWRGMEYGYYSLPWETMVPLLILLQIMFSWLWVALNWQTKAIYWGILQRKYWKYHRDILSSLNVPLMPYMCSVLYVLTCVFCVKIVFIFLRLFFFLCLETLWFRVACLQSQFLWIFTDTWTDEFCWFSHFIFELQRGFLFPSKLKTFSLFSCQSCSLPPLKCLLYFQMFTL